jgi:hypothetical protein
MSEFKLQISDIMVGANTVRVFLFVAPDANQTFQLCGELTLTVEEARALKVKVES